jgi:hypothetical protein
VIFRTIASTKKEHYLVLYSCASWRGKCVQVPSRASATSGRGTWPCGNHLPEMWALKHGPVLLPSTLTPSGPSSRRETQTTPLGCQNGELGQFALHYQNFTTCGCLTFAFPAVGAFNNRYLRVTCTPTATEGPRPSAERSAPRRHGARAGMYIIFYIAHTHACIIYSMYVVLYYVLCVCA